MPHLTLECSDNILEKNISPLLSEIHNLLVTLLPTQLAACQSRVIRCSEYRLGNGSPKNAFVHLSITVFSGRSEALLNTVAQQVLAQLKIIFQESLEKLHLQISIAIGDLPKTYYKYSLEE